DSDALDTAIEVLRGVYEQQTANDPQFSYLVDEIRANAEMRGQKSVSLNLEKRKAERERLEREHLARENARRQAEGLEPIASLEELDTTVDIPGEILLTQAARLAAEMARLENGARQLVTMGANARAGDVEPRRQRSTVNSSQ